jgi:hypothetical protein
MQPAPTGSDAPIEIALAGHGARATLLAAVETSRKLLLLLLLLL